MHQTHVLTLQSAVLKHLRFTGIVEEFAWVYQQHYKCYCAWPVDQSKNDPRGAMMSVIGAEACKLISFIKRK